MLLRILRETFLRRKRRVALGILSVLLGAGLASALLSTSEDILDRMTKELRSYGANILVTPRSEALAIDVGGVSISPGRDYIDESELVRLKTIFWRNNIVGFAPYLSTVAAVNGSQAVVTGTWFHRDLQLPKGASMITGLGQTATSSLSESFATGVRHIAPWWQVEGEWPETGDTEGALAGVSLARRLGLKLGDSMTVKGVAEERLLKVKGILSAGGFEDDQLFVDLPVAQVLHGISKGASRVLVSALTLPEEKLATDIRGKRPEDMTPKEYEKWYCSPIIGAINTQIQAALPGAQARAVRQVSEAEGNFAVKIQVLLTLTTLVALAVSALGVMTTMTTMILERRQEIGAMNALGADSGQVASIFLTEATAICAVGGVAGYFLGLCLARFIGQSIFGVAPQTSLSLLVVTIVLAVGVALAGSAVPVWRAVRRQPSSLLRGL